MWARRRGAPPTVSSSRECIQEPARAVHRLHPRTWPKAAGFTPGPCCVASSVTRFRENYKDRSHSLQKPQELFLPLEQPFGDRVSKCWNITLSRTLKVGGHSKKSHFLPFLLSFPISFREPFSRHRKRSTGSTGGPRGGHSSVWREPEPHAESTMSRGGNFALTTSFDN